MLISLVDEIPGQLREARGTMSVAAPTISVRELIRARMELEWEGRLGDLHPAARLAVPGASFRLPGFLRKSNGAGPNSGAPGLPAHVQPCIEDMVGLALAGFERGCFFVLVNDRQVTALDDRVPLPDATEVTFLRLIPLQGG